MATRTRFAAVAATLVGLLVCTTPPLPAQSTAKKRTPPPASDSTSRTGKPPAPPAHAIPRPKPPESPEGPKPPRRAPSQPPRHPSAHPAHGSTLVYPFVPFVDFDFIYRFPYGLYPYSGYDYPYLPYRFAFPPPGCVTTEVEVHGSLRLDVPQVEAAVYIDGYFVGTVDDFNGAGEHVNLTPGPHHVEIRAPGFEPAVFDVRIEAGKTITYRTPLSPAGSPATARP